MEDLAAFKAVYALTVEVGRLLKCKPATFVRASPESGFTRFAALTGNKDLVWRRRDLPRVIPPWSMHSLMTTGARLRQPSARPRLQVARPVRARLRRGERGARLP